MTLTGTESEAELGRKVRNLIKMPRQVSSKIILISQGVNVTSAKQLADGMTIEIASPGLLGGSKSAPGDALAVL